MYNLFLSFLLRDSILVMRFLKHPHFIFFLGSLFAKRTFVVVVFVFGGGGDIVLIFVKSETGIHLDNKKLPRMIVI